MDEADKIKFAELPLVNEMASSDRNRAKVLLRRLARIKQDAEHEKEIKLELNNLQTKYALKGFRHGAFCFTAREMPGRETLDRGLLIENGIDPRIIAESMKTGKSFVERRFKIIGEDD